jgi:hypothetical protein
MRTLNMVFGVVAVIFFSSVSYAKDVVVATDNLLVMRSDDADACPELVAGNSSAIDSRMLPNGDSEEYAIPAGHLFVVTDVIFRRRGGNEDTRVRLGTPCDPPTVGCMKIFVDSFLPAGEDSREISLRHGFAIQPGIPICASGFTNGNFASASVFGYLIKDKYWNQDW